MARKPLGRRCARWTRSARLRLSCLRCFHSAEPLGMMPCLRRSEGVHLASMSSYYSLGAVNVSHKHVIPAYGHHRFVARRVLIRMRDPLRPGKTTPTVSTGSLRRSASPLRRKTSERGRTPTTSRTIACAVTPRTKRRLRTTRRRIRRARPCRRARRAPPAKHRRAP